MPVVEATTSIHRSSADVFEFIQDARNHAGAQPPGWNAFSIVTPASVGVGVATSFTMQLAGQTVGVQAVIIERDPPRRLVEQCYGSMEHSRTWLFEPIVDRTRVRLMLEYVPQPGLWGTISDRLVLQPQLRRALTTYLENLKFLIEREVRGRMNVEAEPYR